MYGIVKLLYIEIENEIREYEQHKTLYINLETNEIKIRNVEKELKKIQKKLKINFGGFHEEVPEQKMAIAYLTGNEKVLEIGGNIGRNSLIIGEIVKSKNFVTLECDENIAKQLEYNRNQNGMDFFIENSALSKRKLIQSGWNTIPSEIVLEGYKEINTISWEGLKSKYNINFDTLVLDCEGAFYYILMDMPEILENINLIIMENDYHDINQKIYVDETLKKNNFNKIYSEGGGWGCCVDFFFEVWKK